MATSNEVNGIRWDYLNDRPERGRTPYEDRVVHGRTANYIKKYLSGKGFVPSNYAIGTIVVTA